MQRFIRFCKIHVSDIEFFEGVVLLLVLHEGACRSRASAAISTRGHSCQGSLYRIHEILNNYSFSILVNHILFWNKVVDTKITAKQEWRKRIITESEQRVKCSLLYLCDGSVCVSLIVKMPDKVSHGSRLWRNGSYVLSHDREIHSTSVWMLSYKHQTDEKSGVWFS